VIVPQNCSTPSFNNLKTKYVFGCKVLCVVVNGWSTVTLGGMKFAHVLIESFRPIRMNHPDGKQFSGF
jgi:hypothetical protein